MIGSLLHPLEDDLGLGFGFWHRMVVAIGFAFCVRYLFALSLSQRTREVCFDDHDCVLLRLGYDYEVYEGICNVNYIE